ncbi:negative elongation factor E-like isoform X2 [Asterias amurensis]|uniref:negative elongation factor E-like isoform X2 n=1 Tax=Asterias amurensis TaxID=7602 RepID=UPI003AB7F2B5
MVFPSRMTEEEEMLQNKYAKIRKKKKVLQQLKNNKNKPAPLTPQPGTKRALPETSQEDAKEMAKKVLAAEQAKQAKLEENKSSGFKRSRKMQRSLKEPEKAPDLPIFQPFVGPNSGPSSGEETSPGPNMDGRKLHKKNLYDNFVSSRKPSQTDIPDGSQERKRGNTVYVHGRGISHELCDKAFKKFGTIANINMEQEKSCAFITFDNFEAADKAINEMNNKMVSSTVLHVSLARHQPDIHKYANNDTRTVGKSTWGDLAQGAIKGSRHKDKREKKVYDDDLFQ